MEKQRIPEGECECSVCHQIKDNGEFSWYKNRFTKDGYRLRINTNCCNCQKILSEQRKQVAKKIEKLHPRPESGSLCDLCGKHADKFECDHTHGTEVFRGWLCKHCNVGLGKLGDDTDGILNALKYLLKTANLDEKNRVINVINDLMEK